MNCWRCHEKVGGPVCAGCGTIQPPPPDPDHFAVLGIPRRWTLAPAEVEAAWRARSRLVHPDRFAGHPAVERRMSLQWTAAINAARAALREPVSRAWYLATGSARPREEGRIPLDPDFLEEVFELQVQAQEDPEGIAEQARRMRAALMAELDLRLQGWERQDLVGLAPTGVEELLARTRYLDNLSAPAA